MKWEQYKALSLEDREEWNFRFKPKVEEQPRHSLLWVVLIWVSSGSLAAITLVIIKDYVQVKIAALEMFSYINQVAFIMVLAWLLDYIGSWVVYGIWKYEEQKWLKTKITKGVENNG